MNETAHPDFDTRDDSYHFANDSASFKHILDSPVKSVQLVKSRLLNLEQVYEHDETLEDFSHFLSLATPDTPQKEDYLRVLNAARQEELFDTYVDCVLTKPGWIDHDDQPDFEAKLKVLGQLLTDIKHLVRCARTVAEPAHLVDALAGPRTDGTQAHVPQFLKLLYEKRRTVFATTLSGRKRGKREDFAEAVLLCTSELETLYNHQHTSLVAVAPEVGSLFACSWSHSKIYPTKDNIEKISEHISNPNTKDDWDHGLKSLMSGIGDAKAVMAMCISCMRKDITNEALGRVLTVTNRLMDNCPADVYAELRDDWIRLLPSLARACERQLCSGDYPTYQEQIMPSTLHLVNSIMFYPYGEIYRYFMPHFEKMDLISQLAKYSVYAVTQGNFYTISFMQKIIGGYQQQSWYLANRQRDRDALSRMFSKARKIVVPSIRDLRRVPDTNPQIINRRDALLGSWDQYSSMWRLYDPSTIQALERPIAIMPGWHSCANRQCLCFVKKTCHSMRVCKGCWQTFYCNKKCQTLDWHERHAQICRRIQEANSRV